MQHNYEKLHEEKLVSRSQHQNPQYDPDKIPPSWIDAADHERSRAIGVEDEVPENEINICDCCGYQVQRKVMGLCEPTIKLSFLGSGYPLFFQFIQYCIFILITIFITSGLFNIFTNMKADDCISLEEQKNLTNSSKVEKKIHQDNNLCFNGFIMNVSIANKKYHGKELFMQQIINLITIIIIMIILQVFRRNQRITNEHADADNVSPSDYTIMLKKVREDSQPLDYDEEIVKIIKDKGIPGKQPNIKKVNLCFDLDEVKRHQAEKQKAISQYQSALKYQQKNGQFPDGKNEEFYKNQIKVHEDELEKLEEIFAQGKTEHFVGTAFVSFNTENEKDEVLESHKNQGLCSKNSQGPDDLIFLGGKIVVEPAPEPNDVLWLNQKVTTKSKVLRRFISFIVTVLMMAGSFAIILYLNKLQIKMAAESDKANQTMEKVMAFAISMSIIVVNVIISMVIVKMSQFEAFSTVTRQNISIAQKSILAQFFNIAFILFVVSYFFKSNIIGIGGLISNVTMIFITNMIIPPMTKLVNPTFIMNRLMLWLKKKEGEKSVLTQSQANLVHQKPEFPIAVNYAEILKIMYFTAFYAPIIPIGILFSVILLISLYWIFKYDLLRRSCVLHSQSAELSIEMTEMLELFCIIFSGSNWIFSLIMKNIKSENITLDEDTHDYDQLIILMSIIGVAIGFINAVLPMQDINEKLFNIDKYLAKPLDKPYDEAEKEFDTNYDIENPATEERAKEERVKKFEKKSVHH